MFSNGIVLLARGRGLLIVAFDADVTRLIQLYIIGVFVSFTLSQAGMVRHWSRELRHASDARARRRIRRSQAINATGAAATAVVLVLSWSQSSSRRLDRGHRHAAALPLMLRIRRHYDRPTPRPPRARAESTLPSRIHAVVPVVKINEPTLRTLAFARGIHPDDLTAVTVRVDPAETDELFTEWVAPRHPGAADRAREPVPGHHPSR